MRFSHRTPVDLRQNRITVARTETPPTLDLTVSNPTAVGLSYPPELLHALADAAGLAYAPDPRGLAAARAAVVADLARRGVVTEPDRVCLTASTSEAYTFLFKLLCDPGDSVLVPAPSYPLFEHLARLEAVQALPYRLDPDAAWRIDFAALDGAPAGVRAVVVVHPNNPTGSFIDEQDREALLARCAERGWALIADEVFLDYTLDRSAPPPVSFAGSSAALTFALGGLSKSVGLPQLKLAWIVAAGPDQEAGEALERLDVIADSFLSVATPVQLALPGLLAEGATVRAAIRSRCEANLNAFRTALGRQPALALYPPAGGWSAVLRMPAVVPEEDLVVDLIRLDGVAVHPGYFFDFPSDGFLVASLLPEPGLFAEGVRRLVNRIAKQF